MRNLDHFRVLAARLFAAFMLAANVGSALADVHCVDLNCTNATPPYTNWTTAATNIQDAVDAAVAGDEVVVTNGIYATGGRNGNSVEVDKPLALRSVNGPQFTSIYGRSPFYYGEPFHYVRCIHLTAGASLSGFTLAHGSMPTGGGGVMCDSTNAVVSNCVITGNQAASPFLNIAVIAGGGAYGGTLNNCIVTGNVASVSHNLPCTASGGGAAYCVMNNCVVTGNSANATNINMAVGGTTWAIGGGAYSCTLNNCVLFRNSVSAKTSWGQAIATAGGAYICALNNCILVGNFPNQGGGTGSNNWYGDPMFVDPYDGNFRLYDNSPCINAGNNAFAPTGADLDGNPRISGGTVDIGAYEFQSPPSIISYAWLQQFNLRINASTDTADPDGDGVDNYHEWLAGTDPTNPFSSPAQLTITPSGTNVILTWPTNAAGFTLQSTTNLGSPVWSTNSPAPVVIGGQNLITNPIAGPQKSYRLMH